MKASFTIDPIHRLGVTTTALLLHDKGLEREWVARVISTVEVTNGLLERESPLSPAEWLALKKVWHTLSNEAAEKLKAHQSTIKIS
jgi:hypothetical protein